MSLKTIKQAAEFLGLSTRTIHTYIKDGRIKAVRVGTGWRISTDELERIEKYGTEKPADTGAATEADKEKE